MALVWWLLLFHFVGASFEAPRGFAPLGVEHGGGRSVLVTGAGGRTGALLLEALCGQSEFTAVYGMVRSSQKAATLQQRLATVAEKAVQPQIVVGDVRHPQTLVPLMKGLVHTRAFPRIPSHPLRGGISLTFGRTLLPVLTVHTVHRVPNLFEEVETHCNNTQKHPRQKNGNSHFFPARFIDRQIVQSVQRCV
eukprot:EG_transcript_32218